MELLLVLNILFKFIDKSFHIVFAQPQPFEYSEQPITSHLSP